MPQMNLTSSASSGGMNITSQVNRTFDSVNPIQPNQPAGFPAGKVVTAWAKTDADTAEGDLPGGHGYTDGKFDVFWQEDGVNKRRWQVDGTIASNALTLDGGTGDDFPASATEGIVVVPPLLFDCPFNGDGFKALAAIMELLGQLAAGRGSLTFYDADDVELVHFDLPMAPIDVEGGAANPFASEVPAYVAASNGSSTSAATLKIILGTDTTV